ncbi:FAD synthetase 2, chloroplastic-like isoform X2 [Pistacia vera]|uniref:FAD synthetase 2, chloroplastic-like isoform X1 n=1 Tax=Pistacia vera TaxID=55513 RepID=UPI0012639E6F|nr:FAD synthetase 2, chloroplastic-like isoform X1 [Pistacia vera]XP_031274902.1 FAD synthetase 2, chloroplastic-like isoform X2 [Pistacia vera]
MLSNGSRISLHIRESRYHQNLGLGFCTSKFFQLSSFMVRPLSVAIIGENYNQRLQRRSVSSSSLQSKSPGELPLLSECFSQREDERELPPEGLYPVAGGIVALGKFDALHVGHRELAIQASKVGAPYLLSFVGMAEVFGWEPRAPIVAKCDRKRVLSSWAPHCGGVAPVEFQIEFSSVRHLTPQQFVEKLSKDFGVNGVVAGENYRFGYKAAGDASELVRLCGEYGMDAYIINSVMDKNQDSRDIDSKDFKERGQVSSTRVRHALAIGDMKYVSELLGRPHRLILMVNDQEELTSSRNKHMLSVSKSCLLNLPPKEGFYENCTVLFGDENPVRCRIFIDSTRIHLEMDEVGLSSFDNSQDLRLLGIEFGVLES